MDEVSGIEFNLILAVIAALGLIMGLRALYLLRWARASRAWPTTSGIVTTSEFKITHGPILTDEREADTYWWKTYLTPEVKYEYRVEGVDYSGSQIRFDDSIVGKLIAGPPVGQYPPGGTVDVYYDPADPRRAVLEPGLQAVSSRGIVVSILFAAAGGYLMYVMLYSLFTE